MEPKPAAGAMPGKWSGYQYAVIALLFFGWVLGGLDRTLIFFAVPSMAKAFGFSATQVGLVISAFFAGYMLMQIPGGILADKLGPRKVLLTVVFVWSIFTGLTGIVTGLFSMLAVRFVFGLGEGPFSPAAGKLIAMSFPRKDVAKAGSMMLSSSAVVMILAPVFSVYMISRMGWRSVFFLVGAAGIAIVILYYLFLRPVAGPAAGAGRPAAAPIPFKVIFRIPMVWSLCVANFGCYTLIWGLSAWMPSYLMKGFGINLKTAGWLQSIPGFGALLGMLVSGFIIDRLNDRDNQYVVAFAAACSSLALYCIYRGGLGIASIIMIQTGVNLVSSYVVIYMGTLLMKKLPAEIVGSTLGTTNFAAQLGSFFAPFIMGMIVDFSGGRIGASFWYLFVMGAVIAVSVITMRTSVAGYLPEPAAEAA